MFKIKSLSKKKSLIKTKSHPNHHFSSELRVIEKKCQQNNKKY